MVFEPPKIVANSSDQNDYESLVEQIFYSPKQVNEGEYIIIYEFLLDNPEVRDDPQKIVGVLKEFAGWAQYMLEQMQRLGLVEASEESD